VLALSRCRQDLVLILPNETKQEEEEERSAKEEEAELLALSAVHRYQMCAGKIPG
jgi:hypothetical protein